MVIWECEHIFVGIPYKYELSVVVAIAVAANATIIDQFSLGIVLLFDSFVTSVRCAAGWCARSTYGEYIRRKTFENATFHSRNNIFTLK